MNKNIFDEALKEISYATIDLEDLEIIVNYDVDKIERALKLGKLYEEFHEFYHMRFSTTSGADDLREVDKKIRKFYKELEND